MKLRSNHGHSARDSCFEAVSRRLSRRMRGPCSWYRLSGQVAEDEEERSKSLLCFFWASEINLC